MEIPEIIETVEYRDAWNRKLYRVCVVIVIFYNIRETDSWSPNNLETIYRKLLFFLK